MKLLVTKGVWHEAQQHIAEIEEMGHEVFFMLNEEDELPCDPSCIEGVLCDRLFLFHSIEDFTNVKFIQIYAAGYDRLPIDYCKSHNIPVYNVGDTYAVPMSEYIISHILEWYQNIYQEHQNRWKRGWIKNRDKQELTGKDVLIIGTGNVARYTAKKLQAFDCHIVAISHTPRDLEYIDEVLSYASLHEELKKADIVVITTPFTGQQVITQTELNLMKPTAILVNVSRGTLIDQQALLHTLKTNGIEAAILDVYEEEPLQSTDELWSLSNAILTPHSSFIGRGNAERLWNTIRKRLLNEQ